MEKASTARRYHIEGRSFLGEIHDCKISYDGLLKIIDDLHLRETDLCNVVTYNTMKRIRAGEPVRLDVIVRLINTFPGKYRIEDLLTLEYRNESTDDIKHND